MVFGWPTCTNGGGTSSPAALSLPGTIVGTQGTVAFAGAQYSMTVNTVPSGYSITSSEYGAWCTNQGGNFAPSATTYTVYNSYDAYNTKKYEAYLKANPTDFNLGFAIDYPNTNPGFAPLSAYPNITLQEEWNAVNWVLNNSASVSTPAPNTADIQAVIWQLLHPDTGVQYTLTFPGVDGNAPTLYTAAITHLTFVPTTGVVAVILDPGAAFQGVIIAVPLPSSSCSNNSSVSLTRCVSVCSANAFQEITYGYTVTNTGSTTLTDIVVTDDNGTPDYVEDDFVVGTIASLAPGKSQYLQAQVYLPVRLFATWGSNTIFDTLVVQPAGTVIATGTPGGASLTVPNGELYLHYLLDTDVMDNTFGASSTTAGAAADWAAVGGHDLWQDTNINFAEFALYNSSGTLVSDFREDFLTSYGHPNGGAAQSGYGTAGLHGPVIYGSSSIIAGLGTSISDDVNEWSFYKGGIPNSVSAISPDSSPTWQTISSYKALINESGFTVKNSKGQVTSSGFGSVAVVQNYINFSKINKCDIYYQPQVVTTKIVDTAYVTAYSGCCPVNTKASICVTLNGCPPPTCSQIYMHKCQHQEQCRCTCSECQAGNHNKCTKSGCSDVRCGDLGCPWQHRG
jgi:hypothetical protein